MAAHPAVKYRPSISIAQKFIAQRRVPMAKAAFIATLTTAIKDDRPARYSIWASSTKLDAGCQPSLSQGY
jgi:hypothetical protein